MNIFWVTRMHRERERLRKLLLRTRVKGGDNIALLRGLVFSGLVWSGVYIILRKFNNWLIIFG